MMILPFPHLSLAQPARYSILVQGWLGEGWEDWFEGMRLTRLELRSEQWLAETSLLTGIVPDQAALLGMLQRLYTFGLPILKVEIISQDEDRSE
jgi:hypothetical protein